MFTIVIKFIKKYLKLLLHELVLLRVVYFNFYSYWNRIISNCVISRFI